MDTLKNFFIGLIIVIVSLIILGLVMLTWPILIGISSILLSILAFVLFLTFIFYIVVLIGHSARNLFQK
ncbi:MAG: hypothetical protein P9L90_03545 [Candidatus Aadella gelida]|nr:hypothetical protein [Candidatus Aadella gelida]